MLAKISDYLFITESNIMNPANALSQVIESQYFP